MPNDFIVSDSDENPESVYCVLFDNREEKPADASPRLESSIAEVVAAAHVEAEPPDSPGDMAESATPAAESAGVGAPATATTAMPEPPEKAPTVAWGLAALREKDARAETSETSIAPSETSCLCPSSPLPDNADSETRELPAHNSGVPDSVALLEWRERDAPSPTPSEATDGDTPVQEKSLRWTSESDLMPVDDEMSQVVALCPPLEAVIPEKPGESPATPEDDRASGHVDLIHTDMDSPAVVDGAAADANLDKAAESAGVDVLAGLPLLASDPPDGTEKPGEDGADGADAARRFAAEIDELRQWLDELTDLLRGKEAERRELAGLLAARDEVLKLQNDELQRLRGKVAAHDAEQEEQRAARREWREAVVERDRLRDWSRELSTITVPELEERNRRLQQEREELEDEATAYRRRYTRARNHVALGYGGAAAAVLLGTCLAGFAWSNAGQESGQLRLSLTEAVSQRNDLDAQLAALREDAGVLETRYFDTARERDDLRRQHEEVSALAYRQKVKLEASGAQIADLSTKIGRLERELRQGGAGTQLVSSPAKGEQPGQLAPFAGQVAAGGAPEAIDHPARNTPTPAHREAVVRPGEGVGQVLARELGEVNSELIEQVVRDNGLRRNARGAPLLQVGQVLRLPGRSAATVAAAMQ